MKIRVFWDIAQCSLVVVDRRFRGAYCLHHRPYDGGHTQLCNVGIPTTTNAEQYPRRLIFTLAAVRTLNPIYQTSSETIFNITR
jgi:hypothetical protein